MQVESEHLETQTALLQQIAGQLDATSRRVVPDLQQWSFSVGAAGVNLILPPSPGNRIFVAGYVLVAAGAVTVAWGTTSGTTFTPLPGMSTVAGGNPGDMALSANGGASVWSRYPYFVFQTSQAQGLALNLSGAIQVGGHLLYWKA